MKIILDNKEYKNIWDNIYSNFKFDPSVDQKVNPFEFDNDYVCYKLNSVWSEEQEKIVNEIFKEISQDNLYALDWNHDCFEYNPSENIELDYHYHDNDRNVEVYFPSYYPNGDYYFFVSKDLKYGMLGHPWRKEIYVFGKELIEAFSKNENELNITK